MTHVIETVQHSSLKLLDIIIEHMPELIREHAAAIFDNFIEQISKHSLRGDRRVLKNDPYKLTSTQTWRYDVLHRLHVMLLVVLHGSSGASEKSTPANRQTIQVSFDRATDSDTPSSTCIIEMASTSNSPILDDKRAVK
jgi:hypothetical protein